MKKDLKEMRAAFGRVHEFLMVLEKAGFTEEIIVEIINSKGNQLAGEMFNALPEPLRTKWKMSDLNLTFKVRQNHEEFLSSASSNDDEEIFAKENRVLHNGIIDQERLTDTECQIFHFNYVISNNDAIREMKKQGCRPATEYEVLMLCKLNPVWASNYKICALGVIYKHGHYCYYPRFCYYKNRILVENHCDENSNSPSMRFLGVKIK